MKQTITTLVLILSTLTPAFVWAGSNWSFESSYVYSTGMDYENEQSPSFELSRKLGDESRIGLELLIMGLDSMSPGYEIDMDLPTWMLNYHIKASDKVDYFLGVGQSSAEFNVNAAGLRGEDKPTVWQLGARYFFNNMTREGWNAQLRYIKIGDTTDKNVSYKGDSGIILGVGYRYNF